MLLLETDLNRFSENDIQAIIESLPSSWQTRILRKKPFRSRLQSAVGYSLLRQILQEQFLNYNYELLQQIQLTYQYPNNQIMYGHLLQQYPTLPNHSLHHGLLLEFP